MADALLGFMVGKLDLLVQKEFGLIWGVDNEMKDLSSLLSTIQAVLEDAEEKQITNKPIQNWLRKVKDAAYKVDDILDECATEAALLESNAQNSSFINKVRSSCLTPHNIMFRHKIGSRMRDIGKRLDGIAKERSDFHLTKGDVDQRRSSVIENRQTCSIVSQSETFYGREEDKKRIVECLVEKDTGPAELSVYPIVGTGGLGKTTLAQLVFNDEKIKSHFEPRIWVCISEDFSVRRILKAIIESATGSACGDLDLEPLQKRLRDDILNGKRYLLVLDDIWNEDREKWYKLKDVLACGSSGASIIVTTRIPPVASIMGTMPPHELSRLTEDDCWSLFKKHAFINETAFRNETEERPYLVELGKEIVEKCEGVPLAVKSLGSMMRNQRMENQWLYVARSELWNLPASLTIELL